MNVFEEQQVFLENLEPIKRLSRDIKAGGKILTFPEARFLVDAYYTMQDNRIRTGGQIRALNAYGEPNSVIVWLNGQNTVLEKQVGSALDMYSRNHPVGQWMRMNYGIGPVIAAGFLAHLDVTKTNSAGGFWKFAGLIPSIEWKKGEIRPWNAKLKTLCWKLGESFVKVSGKDDAFYAKEYLEKKAFYIERNSKGDYQEEALNKAEKVGKGTLAYKWYSGKQDGTPKLPPAHIHAMAKRHAVKMFLSHLFEIMYIAHHGKSPPEIYATAILGHKDYVAPPFKQEFLEMMNGETIDMKHPVFKVEKPVVLEEEEFF